MSRHCDFSSPARRSCRSCRCSARDGRASRTEWLLVLWVGTGPLRERTTASSTGVSSFSTAASRRFCSRLLPLVTIAFAHLYIPGDRITARQARRHAARLRAASSRSSAIACASIPTDSRPMLAIVGEHGVCGRGRRRDQASRRRAASGRAQRAGDADRRRGAGSRVARRRAMGCRSHVTRRHGRRLAISPSPAASSHFSATSRCSRRGT